MPSEPLLSEVLSEFARTIVTDFPIQGILDRLVVRIVDVLPITAAGVTLISPGAVPRYVAASNETALRFEQLQTELGEGPCVVAYQTGAAVTVPDLHADDRFPVFGPRALAEGMEAVFTFPLRDGDDRMGALDLYRDIPGSLDAGTMAAAQTLADVAAAYLLNAQARADLRDASDRFRRGEAKHRRLATQLAAAQRVAGVGSWEWAITTDTLWWSDELCRICGMESDQAPRDYEGYLAVLHPDDRHMADAAIQRGIRSGGVDRIASALRTGPPWTARTHPVSLSVGVAWLDPASATSIEELMSQADAAMYRDKETNRRRSRLVVVEDDANMRRLTALSLGDRYDVTTVGTAGAALAAVAKEAPDVLLLDLGLPDMHGSELLRHLRSAPGGDRVPVIVITGSAGPTDELTSLQQGVNDYIIKPYDVDVLDARIRNVLARSPSPRA